METNAQEAVHPQLEPPKIVSMTMTSRCNLKCVMCDHGIRKVKKEDFQPDLVDMAGDFIASASLVDLTGLGEPMISDLFWSVLGKFPVSPDAGDKQFFLTFNSNGTLLNKRNIERILQSRTRKIRISLDSADPMLFSLIRGTELTPIVESLRALVKSRQVLGRRYPEIGVEMTLMRANLTGICEMIDLCVDMGVDFLEVWSLNHVTEASFPWRITKGNWTFDYAEQMIDGLPADTLDDVIERFTNHAVARNLPVYSRILGTNRVTHDWYLQEAIALFGGQTAKWKENSIFCDLPWKELRITYDGDVFACCWGPRPIGNLRTQTLESIWKGVAMQQMRADLIEGVVPDLCSGAACAHVMGQFKEVMQRNDAGDGIELSAIPVSYERSTGLYDLENYNGRPLRWTNGSAEFHVTPQIPPGPVHLAARFWHIFDTSVTISVNGNQVFRGSVPTRGLDASVDLGVFNTGESFIIRIDCPARTTPGDARKLGVPIESLRLISGVKAPHLPIAERPPESVFPILTDH